MIIIKLLFFLFITIIILSIIWFTLKTGISPMVSSNKARDAMLDAISKPVNDALIDLGSGWGTLVISAAKKYPNQQVVGYELSWFPWLVSMLRKKFLRLDNLTLYRKDFKTVDFNHASVLFCYLFPEGMLMLNQKLNDDQYNNILIISNTFALPLCKTASICKLNDFYKTPIYIYNWQPGYSDV